MPKLITQSSFNHKHFTTTKSCADMKDPSARRAVMSFAGLDPQNLIIAQQTHGVNVKIVSKTDRNKIIGDCDALICADPEIILGIFTADCMPIMMACAKRQVIAAVHAGWRGLAGGIIEKTAQILKNDFNAAPEEIDLYIGPHICKRCYEVSSDFEKIFGLPLENGKMDLSLAACNKASAVGIVNSTVSSLCTCNESDLFFSYRRDKSKERQLTFLSF
ncbi:MAG: polyphenol oxidase family protein [Endomicrobium sp.]|jgi:YfiH family protein|nr:polyphenol oxidase family protein [Endomicrobium sp.]